LLKRTDQGTRAALRQQREILARRRRQRAKYERDRLGIAVVRVEVRPRAEAKLRAAGYTDADLGKAVTRMLDDLAT